MQLIPSVATKKIITRTQPRQQISKQFADQSIFHKSFSSLARTAIHHDGKKHMYTSTDFTNRRIGSGRALIYTRKCAQTERIEKENLHNMNNIFDVTSWEKQPSLQLIKRIKTKMEQNTKKQQIVNILNQILQRPVNLMPIIKDTQGREKMQGNDRTRRELWSKKKVYNHHAKNNRNMLKRTHIGPFQSKKVENEFSGWTKGSLSQFQSLQNSFLNTDRNQVKNQ